MRPKIVVLTLAAALGLIAIVAVLAGVLSRGERGQVKAPDAPPVETALQTVTAPEVVPDSTTNRAIPERLHATELAKDLDQIRELQAGGGDDPNTTSLLLAKLTHKDREVRLAAVEALVQLSDTNAIPGLEQAQAMTDDPYVKVALMDAIEYLRLPQALPTPDTNGAIPGTDRNPIRLPPRRGPRRLPGTSQQAPAAGQPGVPADPAAPPAQ
jgi:HEAT repeat protein